MINRRLILGATLRGRKRQNATESPLKTTNYRMATVLRRCLLYEMTEKQDLIK